MRGMFIVLAASLLLVLAATAQASQGGISSADITRLTNIFKAAATSQDLAKTHWAARGLAALGQTVPEAACNTAKAAKADNIVSVYQAAAIASASSNCKLSLSAESAIKSAIAGDDAANIRYAVEAAKALGISVNVDDVLTSITKILGGEYSASAAGHAFTAAAKVGAPSERLNRIYDSVEDVLHQSETTDNTFAFEGGLVNTATILSGAYELADAVNRAPAISSSDLNKLVNYLVASKFSSAIDQAASLAISLNTLATNKFHNPVVVYGDAKPLSGKNANVVVYATNTLGNEVSDLTVSATLKSNNKAVVSDKALSANGGGKYSAAVGDLPRGEYKVVVSVKSGSPKNIVKDKTLAARVVGAVVITDAQLSVSPRSVKDTPAGQALSFPNTAATVVKADDLQKIVLRFRIRDAATKEDVAAHQVFLRFTHKVTGNEVFLVGDTDASKQYVIDVDLGDKSADTFDATAGDYAMDLIVGDATFEAAIEWKVATVAIDFRTRRPAYKPEPKEFFQARPEIFHTFREPESRPPAVVSLAFLALVLAPALLLPILWIKLDANISNFPGSPYAIAFHVCVGSILYLYFTFWLNGNMFDTLKYLAVLSIPTLITGKRTLALVSAKRAAQSSSSK